MVTPQNSDIPVGRVAAQVRPDLYAGLKWRDVGPFHGGRISSVSDVIGQPGVFCAGTPLGGPLVMPY